MSPESEFPLVTFAVFAFNQERFIEDAIRGAFAQDYPNLEIALSDDGSSDGTYEKMQAAAAAYRGPHRVIVNRTKENGGTLAHLYEVVLLTGGELIVCAAGDDVSYPDRVSVLVKHWKTNDADGLHSLFDVINEDNEVIERNYHTPSIRKEYQDYFPDRHMEMIHGASSAYSRRSFAAISLPPEKIFTEDAYIALLLTLRSRKVVFVDEPLVQYRRHDGAMTNFGAPGLGQEIVDREHRLQTVAHSVHRVLSLLEQAANKPGAIDPDFGVETRLNRKILAADIAYWKTRGSWLSGTVVDRLRAILRARRRMHLYWLVPRLFGTGQLVWMKRVRSLIARSRRPPATRRSSDTR